MSQELSKGSGGHPFEELYAPFQDIPLFSGLAGDTLLVFYIAAREIIARPGETIVREGDSGEELFIIGRGKVKVLVQEGKENETLIAELGPRDFFGEMCVIEPTNRSATVIASEITFLYGLKSSTLNKIYQVWPEAQATIMANLSRTLAERVERLDPCYRDRGW